MRVTFVTALLVTIFTISSVHAQQCNKLGAWLWYLEITKFENYSKLADSLSRLGVKRVYVKVADGRLDSVKWGTVVDNSIPAAFAEKGIEAWAWSYNYPGNTANQAKAMYHAAKSGYKGYVVDVEKQFDGNRNALNALFSAFHGVRLGLKETNIIDDSFKLYCTTWGNPRTHNFYLDAIDPYIDGYLSQTYVENWGINHLNQIETCIDRCNLEYREMGATKPVHHSVSTEKGNITPEQVNRFLRHAGEESSIWPIPGTNTSLRLWDTWKAVDWHMDFYLPSFTYDNYIAPSFFYPNPARDLIVLNDAATDYKIVDSHGYEVISGKGNSIESIDVNQLISGFYILSITSVKGEEKSGKLVIVK